MLALHMLQEGELNPALRFANVTFWWCLLCGLQWLVAWGITERYILEQPELRYTLPTTETEMSSLLDFAV